MASRSTRSRSPPHARPAATRCRHARGLESLTLRSWPGSPPDEEWVIVGYESQGVRRSSSLLMRPVLVLRRGRFGRGGRIGQDDQAAEVLGYDGGLALIELVRRSSSRTHPGRRGDCGGRGLGAEQRWAAVSADDDFSREVCARARRAPLSKKGRVHDGVRRVAALRHAMQTSERRRASRRPRIRS